MIDLALGRELGSSSSASMKWRMTESYEEQNIEEPTAQKPSWKRWFRRLQMEPYCSTPICR